MRAAAIVVAAVVLCGNTGCGGGSRNAGGGITTFDVEAAIDNPQTFDLAEVARNITFIPLDDSRKEGLLGEITGMAASRGRFYVQDRGQEFVLKVFDRQGGFISTLGRYGRGPDEWMGRTNFATDHDRDMIYVAGQMGGRTPTVAAYDSSGSRTARRDSISGERIAFHDGRLVVMKGSPRPFAFGDDPDFVPSIGTSVPLLEVWSPALEREQVVETVDKGTGAIIMMQTDGGEIKGISVLQGVSGSVLSGNGADLLVKEPLSDTLYHFRGGALEPVYRFDYGKYLAPPESFGLNPAKPSKDGCMVKTVFEGDRYLIVDAGQGMSGDRISLVLDKENPAGGLSARGGADEKPGLFLDGVAFTPMYVRDNRLVGYITALALVDGADGLSNPDLRALASTLREESNPVVVEIELN